MESSMGESVGDEGLQEYSNTIAISIKDLMYVNGFNLAQFNVLRVDLHMSNLQVFLYIMIADIFH